MNSHTEWPNVLRVAWLTGGISASSEPGRFDIDVRAGTNGPTIGTLAISSYPSLFQMLQDQGFQLIGVSFVLEPTASPRLYRPEFRTFAPRGWLPYDVKHKWRQIAVAAGKGNRMDLMDIASRIASGLTYAESRLGDLARAYSFQLGCRMQLNGAKEYELFQDQNGFEVYKAIHALFWDLAVLRDALAQFVGTFCFSRPEIRSMKGLRKVLRGWTSRDPLAEDILRITDHESGGWLGKFTAYRNCFTHLAPLQQAEGFGFVVQDMRKMGASSVPQIYYPLPGDVEALRIRRSAGPPFQSLKDLQQMLLRPRQRTTEPDALEYLHDSLILFAELSGMLVSRSPVAPKPIQITREDMRDGA